MTQSRKPSTPKPPGPPGQRPSEQPAPPHGAPPRKTVVVNRHVSQGPVERRPDNLLNVRQVAQLINVKESTIRHWVHVGCIPYVKFPGAVRFQEAEVLEWIDQRKRGGTPILSQRAAAILLGRR